MFMRFTETNDHEGETWTFWLQIAGNREALLTKWGGQGYMNYHTKVTGTLTIPTDFAPDHLYKGDIAKLFAEAGSGE